jgi:hypothetical protein
MDEHEMIPDIISSVEMQTYKNFNVYVCVNQKDEWWDDPYKRYVCNNNQLTIEYLNNLGLENYFIIDRSSRGKGWSKGDGGAGRARKIIMDQIASVADDNDLIVSMDGDTTFNEGYFESIIKRFESQKKQLAALSNPYYHPLTGNEMIDRALLRYEIYLRYYLINMLRIKSPYAFTALGSAIVVPVWAYRAVKGISPVKNGEDFYFLQKLAKYKKISNWNTELVFPSGRLSDRVDFGTGPALKSGIEGNWNSYPIFDYSQFDKIQETYRLFHDLYNRELTTPMTEFLQNQLKTDDIWAPMRKNFTDVSRFVHACHCRVDGLRIFQFLRSGFDNSYSSDEIRLRLYLEKFHHEDIRNLETDLEKLSFAGNTIEKLNQLRNFLHGIELKMRWDHDKREQFFI